MELILSLGIGVLVGVPLGLVAAARRGGWLDEAIMRGNDLIWSFFVNNYLMGKEPRPFDLLFWNGDSTNLPGPFFSWYFRNTYLENNLKVPGRAQAAGLPLEGALSATLEQAERKHIAQVLGEAKKAFEDYGSALDAVDKKLDEAIRKITRNVAMEEIGKKPEVKVIISRLAAD